jgi:hypothetical protein
MPSNWNVPRETHTAEELEQILREWDVLIDGAVPGTREHTEHVNARRHYARRLDKMKEKEERREKDEKRDAKDIVDEAMGR